MSDATERVVLRIDDPDLTTKTQFCSPRFGERPSGQDPSFDQSNWQNGVLRTYIVVRPPEDGREILKNIRQHWQDGNQAWARQHVQGDDAVDMRIVGIRVVRDDSDAVVFRLYTPAEGVCFDDE